MSSWLADVVVAISDSTALSIVLKASVLFAGGWLALSLLPRARAAVRHLVLAAVFAMAGALPLLVVALPAVSVPVAAPRVASPVSPAVTTTLAASATERGSTQSPPPAQWRASITSGQLALMLWIAGAIVCAVPLARAAWWVRGLRRTAIPWPDIARRAGRLAAHTGHARALDVVQHEATPTPLTFGYRRPVIVFPREAAAWDDDGVRRALVHELEHVHRRDWLIHGMARAVCAIYWFQPLAWWAWRRLALEAERACDDAVVNAAEGAPYARQLVDLAGRLSATAAPPALGMARRSDLSRRVAALLDAGQARGRAGTAIAATILIVSMAVLAVVSPLRAAYERTDTWAEARQSAAAAIANEVTRSRSERALDAALYEAADAGDARGARELLDAGADPNARLLGDGSPLIAVARRGDLTLARLLVERGADPNVAVPGDGNPLIAAAAEGHAEMIAFLLERGAAIDRVVDGDENALIQASGEGHLAVVQLLIARGADVNARVHVRTYDGGEEWRTPLTMAQRGRHQAVIAALVAAGAR